ncbi:Putative hydroxypyruvate reductase [bacterium HR39]|nr:Putative hydroxypyruvate reductase [bacterium HR39]
MSVPDPRGLLVELFRAAVAAADPARVVPPHLPSTPPRGRTVVVGAGKAAAAMAKAVEDHLPAPVEGLVVTRYGHAVPCRSIEVVEAGHPVPDEAAPAAARRILELVSACGEDDLVLALISGGGSSLLSLPARGLELSDLQAVNRALLAAGATIHEMNCVRRHLSAIAGGRLAVAAWPAPVLTLAISDVPGDDPATIASGPTVPDPTTCADALAILDHYRIAVPERVRAHLEHCEDETPKPGDPRLSRSTVRLVARPLQSLEAAAARAREVGLGVLILGDAIEGEALEAGRVHAGIARSCREHGLPLAPPCVLLSGGETTVTVRGRGRGGRNVEFLLGFALALRGVDGVFALADDTAGIDGTGEAGGGVVTPDTLGRARAAGVDPRAHLADNDALGFFEALGDVLITGPTLTNVNDFRAVLVVAGA